MKFAEFSVGAAFVSSRAWAVSRTTTLSGALRALLESPSCGNSAPPDASPAPKRACSSANRPAPSPRAKLNASVPRNVPGASNTRRVFSSAPETNVVDPDPVWDAFAALLPSPGPSTDPDLRGGRSATQFTRCPWICGRAIWRHPVGGASRVVAGSVETS